MNKTRTIYLASENEGKVKEIKAILSDLADIKSIKNLNITVSWEETGSTFQENSLIKAKGLKAQTSQCVLAEDSGLQVDSLNGEPGIYSSRWAGANASDQDNYLKLLDKIKNVEASQRTASFICCLTYIDENAQVSHFTGELKGHIAFEAKGNQGFGYDPVFIPINQNKTLAQLSTQEKNQISHRKQALDAFRNFLLHN